MRKFIVSDLHGNGAVYDSIIGYLENLAKDSNEEITLYINGDLIDRGEDSARIFLDVVERIETNKSFKIEYLAGNHELMMYQEALRLGDGSLCRSSWYTENGGDATISGLYEYNLPKEKIDSLINFVSNLKLYHKFEEKIKDKNIVLVHSKCPEVVLDNCDLKIKDNNELVEDLVWARRENYEDRIGNKDYFTIRGHQALINRYGFYYYSDQNYLVIDGGCAYYAYGDDRYDHVALTEVLDDSLRILTFNNNNEITFGHIFKDDRTTSIDKLDEYKKYLSKNKVLVK